jgi:nuclease S1
MRSYVYSGLLLLAFSGPAMAWGDLGHEVVCEIALRELNPQARKKVDSLIELDPEFRTFAKSCTWPDHPRIRASEHFVNLSRAAKKIEIAAPCPSAAKCVVTAIDNDMRDIASSDETDQLRLLKSLGHWVGDIHQPIHVSFEDDRGANQIDTDGPCGSTLHSVWDGCIISEKIGQQARVIAIDLRAEITPQKRAEWVPGDVDLAAIVGWANESFAIVTNPNVQYCVQKQGECWYSANQRTYPGTGPKKRVDANDAYLALQAPTVRERLKMAGVRLGTILNTAFGQIPPAEVASAALPRASLLAAPDRRRAPMVAVTAEQWQALLFRLDRLEGALQGLTQEVKSLPANRQPVRR